MGGLTQFYAAHAQFQDVRFCDGNRDSRRPGKRVSLAVEASSVLRWVPVGQGNARIEVVAEGEPPAAAAAAPWPPRAPCDGPVAAAFCDALRQYILSQNLTAVASNDLTQFYEAYPQFKTARFCEEGGAPPKSGGHKRRLKIVVDASSVLRWVPVGQGIGESQDGVGRIEVVGEGRAGRRPRRRRRPRQQRRPRRRRRRGARRGAGLRQSQTHLLAALHAWIVGRNLRDIGVGDLSQFYQAHPEFGLKNWPGGGVRKALDGCPNLRWVEGDGNIPGTVSTARIAVVDTWGRLTVQNEAPPLAPGEVRVYDSTPTAQTFFDALRQWMRAKNVSSLDALWRLVPVLRLPSSFERCYSESR